MKPICTSWVTVSIRCARTYVQSLLGLLVAQPTLHLDVDTVQLLAVAALPALFSAAQNALEEHGANLGPRG